MTQILAVALVVAVLMALIFMYGGGREKIGELKASVKKRKAQREREAKAKEIEAKSAPTDPDDVANAWRDL